MTQATPATRPHTIIEAALVDGLIRLTLEHGRGHTTTRALANSIRRLYAAKESDARPS